MKHFKLWMVTLLLVGFAGLAWADGYDLAYKDTKTFPVTTTAPTTGDQKLIFVAADNKWELFTATSEKLTGSFNGTVGATTPAAGTFTSLTTTGTITNSGNSTSTGTVTRNRTPAADSATTNNTDKVNLTAPVDTTGTNTHQAYDVALTVSNATGGTNTVNGYRFENYTGDAQVNVNAINIGTSDGLGTANGITIGSGWDAGIVSASPITASGGIDGILGGVTPAAATVTTLSASSTVTLGGTALTASAAELNLNKVSTRLVALSGNVSITQATHEGHIMAMSQTGGARTYTLPAATGGGAVYKFIVTAVNTSNYIISRAGSDVLKGHLQFAGDNAANGVTGFETTSATTLTLNGTTTGGAAIADYVELIDCASATWCVRGEVTESGVEATPFS